MYNVREFSKNTYNMRMTTEFLTIFKLISNDKVFEGRVDSHKEIKTDQP